MQFDFEPYRKKYPTMSFKEKQQFYIDQELLFPNQSHWNKEETNAFFKSIEEPIRLMEFGGWKGDTAHNILPLYNIETWDNYELCPSCIEKAICHHEKYHIIIPNDYTWIEGYQEKDYNTLYTVHAIEHISTEELERFIKTIPSSVKYVYFESPLKNSLNDWTGKNNAHVLEMGWNDIVSCMRKKGFTLEYSKGDVKWFRK